LTRLTRGSFRVKEVNWHENSFLVMTRNDRFVSMARHDTKLPVRSVSNETRILTRTDTCHSLLQFFLTFLNQAVDHLITMLLTFWGILNVINHIENKYKVKYCRQSVYLLVCHHNVMWTTKKLNFICISEVCGFIGCH